MKARRYVVALLLVLMFAASVSYFSRPGGIFQDSDSPPLQPTGNSKERSAMEKSLESLETNKRAESNGFIKAPAPVGVGEEQLEEAPAGNLRFATNSPMIEAAKSIAGVAPPQTPPSPLPTTINMTNAPVVPPGQGRPFSGP